MVRLLREYLTEPRVLAIRRGCTAYQDAVNYLDKYKKTFQEDVISYTCNLFEDFFEKYPYPFRSVECIRTSLFI